VFCSKCGKKIEENDEFCKNCGSKVVGGENSKEDSLKEELKEEIKKEIKKEELKEEIKKELKQERLKTKWNGPSCLVSILIFVFIIGIITLGSGSGEDKQISTGLVVFPAITLAGWFAIWLITKLIKSFIKNRRKTMKILGVALLVIFLMIFIPAIGYIFSARNKAVNDFIAFQTSFADVINAKYLRDDIFAGKSNANFNDIKKITQAAVDSMEKEKNDSKYYIAVYDWAGKVNSAAAGKISWGNLPDLPSGVGEVLGSDAAEKFYQVSLDHVVMLKDYGDWAIAKGDKDTMRQIAAELKAEETWQNNLSDQQALDFIDQAYALNNSVKTPKASLPRGGCKGVMPCRKKTGPLIGNLFRSARNYSVGNPDAANEWKTNWSEFLKIVNIENGYNLEGMGVIQNGEVKQQASPMEENFNAECRAKGGTPGGTGGVKDRLPMTLPAGTLNCDYKNNGRNCWDTMTRTGQRFMGGENGCEELHLFPRPASLIREPTKGTPGSGAPNNKPESWNGNYNAQMKKPNCDSSVEITSFQVSGGKIVNLYGQDAQIGTDNHATITYNTGTIMTMKLTFEKTGGKSVAKGTWSSSRGCSGTVHATKSGFWFW
jgi:DNA-directed RNA polymerase subunit RPC12/RpoP